MRRWEPADWARSGSRASERPLRTPSSTPAASVCAHCRSRSTSCSDDRPGTAMTPMPSLVELFGFSIHPAEILVRGTAIYWFLFLLFRFVLRRDTGSMAISDILLVVLVADAAQNAMAGDYKSIA